MMVTNQTPPPAHNQQDALERQAERILNLLRQSPDTGVATIIQMFTRQPPALQQRILERLAAHYAASNSEQLQRLTAELERLKKPPRQLGVLDALWQSEEGRPTAVVSTHEGLLEVAISESVSQENLVPGRRVVLTQGGALVSVVDLPEANATCEFDRLLDDGRILARGSGEQSFVLRPAGELLTPEQRSAIKAGDLLEYHPGTLQALRVAHRSSKVRDYLGEIPDVDWNDVGGLEEVRRSLEEEVLGPIANPEFYEPYSVHPPRGLLLEGPPGVGKTLIVKALGRELLRALNLNHEAPVLFKVKGTALQSSYVGEGPARIRALSKAAREAAEAFGCALVMLDDIEYGGGLHRGVGDGSSPAYSALSATLISEMDGIDDRKSTVLWAATVNRADLLDSALLRAGRFSKKISVPRPGPEAAVQILKVHLRGIPIADGISKENLADRAVEHLFSSSDENLLMRMHFADAGHEEIFPARVLSGAILAEAVRGASLRAIRRDRANGHRRGGGIGAKDLQQALDEQLFATVSAISPGNAHLHYLGLPDDRRVVAVERMDRRISTASETFFHSCQQE